MTDTQRERESDRQTHKKRERVTDRHTKRERESDRQTHKERERD